jgi:hypothetical protein
LKVSIKAGPSNFRSNNASGLRDMMSMSSGEHEVLNYGPERERRNVI